MSETQERMSWATLDGGFRLNAENSDRCWTLVHTQYAFCVLQKGAADWSYRGRHFTVVPGKVYVLEPGEVHKTVRAHMPGDYSVCFFDAAWMERLAVDFGGFDQPHFAPEGVASNEAWRMFTNASKLDPEKHGDELSQSLAQSLGATMRAGQEEPASSRVRPTLQRAKHTLVERYMSTPSERIRLDDVARDLGVGYHRFVRDFSLQFGAAPYQYVKMLRARYVVARMHEGPTAETPTLTALARLAGYSDMPHMSRELRMHFGCAPRELAGQLNAKWLKRTSTPPAAANARTIAL